MKRSGGDSSRNPQTQANPTMGLNFDQSCLLVLERSNQELKDSMMQIVQMLQNWNMNLPQCQRIEHDLGDEFDDPSMENEPEEVQRPCKQQRSSNNIKMKIPPFCGTSSLKEYLEWVQWMEKIFECQDYTETSKVKLVALEFSDFANLWWENVKAQRRR